MTLLITVTGIVQGVGYRPFVARLAEACAISGFVRNIGGIVEIAASGKKEALDKFVQRLQTSWPEGAYILQVAVQETAAQTFSGFRIAPSQNRHIPQPPMLPPDLATCKTCLQEMESPSNRRYRYPLISCTACGPRYSIMETLPYDRNTTSMQDFSMCPACETEYTTQTRRRHAQTISCLDCGPQITLHQGNQCFSGEAAITRANALLQQGCLLALKGIGGYQLACDPWNESAVNRLRALKGRERKPFAVMFRDLSVVQSYCQLLPAEETLLQSSARPILLLQKREKDAGDAPPFCAAVSSESRSIGAFLPYTGLHHMLLQAQKALVMTSCNKTGEPIITEDTQALAFGADAVLTHPRRIVTPLDDSVLQVNAGAQQIIRRSRGYVPLPLVVAPSVPHPIAALGGDLKACFCLMLQNYVYPSQYFGDLESYEIQRAFRRGIQHMQQLFNVHPAAVACDLHPGYYTTQYADALALPIYAYQHHHAHIASVMAEHRLSQCIGIALDGTGYGPDGTVWGCEGLLCRGSTYRRFAHLMPLPLVGGDQAMKDARQVALCYLLDAGCTPGHEQVPLLRAALQNRLGVHKTSSMGRLFDAVSSILQIKQYNSYEGECAIGLENAAWAAQRAQTAPYPLQLPFSETDGGTLLFDPRPMLLELYEAMRRSPQLQGALALGFHHAVADMVCRMAQFAAEESQETAVALSGGVYANRLLTEQIVTRLQQQKFTPYWNHVIPGNDSGLCLGQAWLCAQDLEGGVSSCAWQCQVQ